MASAIPQNRNNQAMTGFAVPTVEVGIVDEAGNELPHDGKSIGEIVARSGERYVTGDGGQTWKKVGREK